MARKRHHYKRRTGNTYEIDVTTFLNLMVVLVPFLLITAVFSRLTIVELNLPSSAGGPATGDSNFRVEVIVREEGMEISNGEMIIATIPKVDEEYDLETLSEMIVELKREYPEHEEASVLMDPLIPYDYLIQVMDIVRSVEVPTGEGEGQGEEEEFELFALFTEISVGEAP
ncbi:MAG: biopolymer transporter ExbD [Gammaproteobacteria bacterium]|nr:biopolymer transporter ExbD [Gammaproteobacteria bacterium]